MEKITDKTALKILFALCVTIMFAPIFFAAFISCEKTEENSATEIPEFKEVQTTVTLDSLYRWAGVDRNLRAGDGNFKFVWVGDGFSNQNNWFFDSLCNRQEAFLKTVYPFDSLWQNSKLSFERKLAKGNFNCVVLGFEALDCNWSKVNKAVLSSQPDHIHVFAYNQGYGTGNGGISVTGVGNTDLITATWFCLYYWREERISGHEIGHGLGCDHALTPTYPANLMSQATNGGCELGSVFLPHQHPTILNHINSRIN